MVRGGLPGWRSMGKIRCIREPPQGVRDRRAILRDRLASHLPTILKTLVKAAKGGDLQAAKLILETTLPPLQERSGTLDAVRSREPGGQGRAVLGACTEGKITPDEAATLIPALAAQGRIVETEDLAQRVAALEEAVQGR